MFLDLLKFAFILAVFALSILLIEKGVSSFAVGVILTLVLVKARQFDKKSILLDFEINQAKKEK